MGLHLDVKEIAEHTMLVDLARNDLASICRPGTRRVERPLRVEKFTHVQHLVSTVVGRLEARVDALHAYAATANMGTVTGAPKSEAMRTIYRIERRRRGFYAGAIGYLALDGALNTALVIRSVRVGRGGTSLQAGAGIVHDSVGENEFAETERKLAGSAEAVGVRL